MKEIACLKCDGTGIVKPYGILNTKYHCPECKGTGRVTGRPKLESEETMGDW